MTLAEDVNTISSFVSHDEVQLSTPLHHQNYDTIILCVSAILHCAESLFHAVQTHGRSLTRTVILCGGIGHSTRHLYAAVAANPRYTHLARTIQGLPEAKVMQVIFNACFDGEALKRQGVNVLVEDQSTNCGANATETLKLLQKSRGQMPARVLIIQDPTMSLRTKMSFEKAFAGHEVLFETCPTFVPRVNEVDGVLRFEQKDNVDESQLWDMDRFLGLILGEVVRLRDDENGYGPRGKGYIGHVDVPEEVILAYERTEKRVQANR
jgi:uncharacterized SAM-binding protein YcdF (DUF218 family)